MCQPTSTFQFINKKVVLFLNFYVDCTYTLYILYDVLYNVLLSVFASRERQKQFLYGNTRRLIFLITREKGGTELDLSPMCSPH